MQMNTGIKTVVDKPEWLMLQVGTHLGTYLWNTPGIKQEPPMYMSHPLDISVFSWRSSPILGGMRSGDACLKLPRLWEEMQGSRGFSRTQRSGVRVPAKQAGLQASSASAGCCQKGRGWEAAGGWLPHASTLLEAAAASLCPCTELHPGFFPLKNNHAALALNQGGVES